jgi:secreted PhoX family phosphatase
MDRPEWGTIDPRNGQVYFTLTNNSGRTVTDKANPREKSRWGHIIRWAEAGNDPAATRFDWNIFLLAGPEKDSQFAGKPLTKDQIHNSPDGLWFDKDGRLWIQTDTSESAMNQGDYAEFGNNQMLCADPRTNELKRFLVGPLGQEITGVITTPDGKTMFVNVQHPGATTTADDFAAGKLTGTWPNQGRYARSATIIITKEDGGVIGS